MGIQESDGHLPTDQRIYLFEMGIFHCKLPECTSMMMMMMMLMMFQPNPLPANNMQITTGVILVSRTVY